MAGSGAARLAAIYAGHNPATSLCWRGFAPNQMIRLLRSFSWQALRHHPWRHATAVLAISLGVALSFAVQLINASAMAEFSQAVRQLSGQADLELSAADGLLPDSALATLAALAPSPDPVRTTLPVLEGQVRWGEAALRIVGVDLLAAAHLPPDLQPQARRNPSRTDSQTDSQTDSPGHARTDPWAGLGPGAVFLNPQALAKLGPTASGLDVSHSGRTQRLTLHGEVAASGTPLALMDIGAAQQLLGQPEGLSRIDLLLAPGVDRDALQSQLRRHPNWPAKLLLGVPADRAQRIDQLSRAYRVNLTVLALVALFTGAFLVFSVLSLSVAQRAQQFALLGVLGCTARERLRLVLAESLVLGLLGSVLGLALGTGLAAAALAVLGGDLGGGFFAGSRPSLQWQASAALGYGGLGVAAALAGGWWPAQQVSSLSVASTLKGLGATHTKRLPLGWSLGLLLAGGLLALLPPIWQMPLGAYLSVAAVLLGGIMALPALTAWLLARLPTPERQLLALLALERARRLPHAAASAVGGVVAALSLAVALTVMVTSFRDSVNAWLDVVLPADLYVRGTPSGGESGLIDPQWVAQLGQEAALTRVQAQRVRSLLLRPERAPITLIARELGDARRSLPIVADPLPTPEGKVGVWVSEAMVDLYGARPGQALPEVAQALGLPAAPLWVVGVWRDYARQNGSVVIDRTDYLRLSGDARINDLALTVRPGTDMAALRQHLLALAEGQQPGRSAQLELATTADIRTASLRMFDRSFAVTYWLQAVAIGIGLFGIAASFSAQVLARRKEFGLLAHLGFNRAQVMRLVACEGAAWTSVGALLGVGLGLLVAVILVHVVNPQSFHWTMDLRVPVLRLLTLGAVVVAAGTLTAWLSARAAASHAAVLAVKEDW